jgi:hypothetical protein
MPSIAESCAAVDQKLFQQRACSQCSLISNVPFLMLAYHCILTLFRLCDGMLRTNSQGWCPPTMNDEVSSTWFFKLQFGPSAQEMEQ